MHTYRGHTRGISTIRFTPDGRWVVSGGYDNVVKVWDLTAGKLLHDFKFHEGHITSLEFHPLEFLLATGSADSTVKLWDLETFELIGSTRPEATGVRTMTFHPDGRTLFCGLDDSLKVYSWEPVICHDTVDVSWSTLGDLCIRQGKLLGCSSYQNSVAVWVADTLHIEPYGVGFVPEESDCTEKKFNILKSDSSEKVRSGTRMSPDYEIKEIKNIYIDSAGANLVSSQKVGPLSLPKVVPSFDLKEMRNPSTEKKSPTMGANAKSGGEALNSFVAPTIVPRDIPMEKTSSNAERETVTFSRTKPGMLLRPAHVRRPSNIKADVEKLAVALASEALGNVPSEKEIVMDMKLQSLNVSEDGVEKSLEEKSSSINSVAKKFEMNLSPEAPSIRENCDESVNGNRRDPSVKIVNGVAVVSGRTRSLVERFERREKLSDEDQSINTASQTVHEISSTPTTPTTVIPLITPEADKKPPLAPATARCVIPEIKNSPTAATLKTPHCMPEMDQSPAVATIPTPQAMPMMDRTPSVATVPTPQAMPMMDRTPSVATVPTPLVIPVMDRTPSVKTLPTPLVIPVAVANIPTPQAMPVMDRTPSVATVPTPLVVPVMDRTPSVTTLPTPRVVPVIERTSSVGRLTNPQVVPIVDRTPSVATVTVPHVIPETQAAEAKMNCRVIPQTDRKPVPTANVTPRVISRADRSPPTTTNMNPRIRSPPTTTNMTPRIRSPPTTTNMTPRIRSTPTTTNMTTRIRSPSTATVTPRISSPPKAANMTPCVVQEVHITPSFQEEPQISGRDLIASNYRDVNEDIMQNHDVFLSTLKSRLTKLQVIQHFWVRNDIKGAINALRKLPDHSVQADVISVLVEKLEILNLDLFSCLLPVLVGLLDSKTERHTIISLEMLLKLVAVFGSVVSSTVSAPRVVGVDLHAEQRLECCKQCFIQLQSVEKLLPALIRRGGLVAKSAMELNLVLQQS
ncbi:katanin p80 WD40 repeat-containing subunit B1 homolog KTN80.2-like isoform X2 [Euphorbia lathyris]